ncbi:uncharacterized protein AMSG_07567 [Thecamonas trahens ATCC 50062]|uniref:GH18 domain-containing protein n=1 Tax=Thecamonas trahens ATCC 50062 TaxID=461836 RepID=A0A0L0DGR5_THETB|nr:hypothetical protein AMSG_07567 [Thecamonas trahens ATCC 50062]KNC51385.1 hypothetical protein AMSG_07567 [Thecamonas trahens ATCC 50062]|eukprot:XP_013756053.1 hypothetical protein AMSG_07567 [Thecamonas trahens ATCC 50062]
MAAKWLVATGQQGLGQEGLSHAAPFFNSIQPWMGLERTGENIEADLKQLIDHADTITAVAYEAYNLGPGGSFVDNNFTNVAPALMHAGLKAYAQVSTCCPWGRPQVIEWAREAAADPKPFVDAAMAAVAAGGFDGYNIDIEPLNGTHADAEGFNVFLNALADALHVHDKFLSVDVGTWTPFFNVSLLAKSRVDAIVLMGTYTGNWTLFQKFVDEALAAGVMPERLVIGLETVDPNTNKPFPLAAVEQRLDYLRARNLRQLAIWDAPIPDAWWPLLRAP